MRIGPAFLQTFVSQVVQSAASITTGVLIARGLGPAGQGRYALFMAFVGLLSTLAALGQFEGHVLASGGERSRGRLLLLRSVAHSAAAVLVLEVTQSLWRRGLGLDGDSEVVGLLLLLLSCEVLALLFRGIALGQHQITIYNLGTLIQRVAYL